MRERLREHIISRPGKEPENFNPYQRSSCIIGMQD